MLAIDEAVKPTYAFDVVVRSNTKFLACRGANKLGIFHYQVCYGRCGFHECSNFYVAIRYDGL